MLKDDFVMIRLPKETKRQFQDIMAQRGVNPADALRKFIADVIRKNGGTA